MPLTMDAMRVLRRPSPWAWGEDREASHRRGEQPSILVVRPAAQHRDVPIPAVELRRACDLASVRALDVIDGNVDRGDSLPLVRLCPQRRAHRIIDEREAD